VLRILWLPDGLPRFSQPYRRNWLADHAAANFKCLLARLCVGARTSDWAMVQMADASRDGAGPFLFLEPEEMGMVLAVLLGLSNISGVFPLKRGERTCLVVLLGQIFKRPFVGHRTARVDHAASEMCAIVC
jgi:hypothetical protein